MKVLNPRGTGRESSSIYNAAITCVYELDQLGRSV